MKQPTEGGSYVYDPNKDTLKQVEKPTEQLNPNVAPEEGAAEPIASENGEPQKRGK